MDFLITAIAFLLVFSIVILIHEFGHFYVAIKSGVKVEEFGIGLPPRIWGKKKGGILYSINWIPFGGFVRLLGEDARNKKLLQNKKSYASKSPWVRFKIVVAGVFMNFLLAWFLLTIGFTFGIQPLILDGDEVLENINNGTIHLEHGIVVEEVKDGSLASSVGFQSDDRIVSVGGRAVVSNDQISNVNNLFVDDLDLVVDRGGSLITLKSKGVGDSESGLSLYEVLFLPRIVISDVKEDSASMAAGLLNGDVVLQVNNNPIYFIDDYEAAVRGASDLMYMVLRNGEVFNLEVNLPRNDVVVLSTVFPSTPAEKAGFLKGDIIVSVDDNFVTDPQSLVSFTKDYASKEIAYNVRRGDEYIDILVTPDGDGLIGVGLSTVRAYENEEVSVYATDFSSSVLSIDDISYPFWIAPIKAVEETGRLSVLTLDMFGNVVRSLVTQFTVPEGVAGPVGIAQLTHVFVQEGILSLLRFMALLSLSLAIINILPFPALDGGRAMFIIVEVLLGRRINIKFEALVHAIGFIILMGFILAVTYHDILRLF